MTRKQDGFEEEQQQHEQLAQVEQPKDGGLSVDQELAIAQVASLSSFDHARLAELLVDYPELKPQLLAAAGANMGNASVQRALHLYDAKMKERERSDSGFIDGMIGLETAVADTTAASTEVDSDLAFTTGHMENDAAVAATTDISTEVAPAPEQVAQVEVVESMKAGDEEMLAATLNDTPEMRGQVIVKATEELGTETVEKAIEVQAEEQQQAPAEAQLAVEPVPAQAVAEVVEHPKALDQEEAWIGNARDYNERHAKLVDEFVQLAGTELRLFDGTVDPTVIVAWQQANGVPVDGRIGPATVAAAREGAKKVTEVAETVVAKQDETAADQPA